ncbi:hypothetical protein Tco_1040627 [Tanacetum coccineum]
MSEAATFWFLLCFITLQLPHICCKPHRADLLYVGKELVKETIPLQSGSRLYHLRGLKQNTWYEVKTSYPASIPAGFSLQLSKADLGLLVKRQRNLLNTEKLIFKNDDAEFENKKSGTYVVLTVEREGVVAIPNAKEREMVIYNIVCDELVVGIPHKAWWVVILGVVCLVVASVIPSFLPSVLIASSADRTRGSPSKNY